MKGTGQGERGWGCAVEGKPAPMLQVALGAFARNGAAPRTLPACDGDRCAWVRQVAECLKRRECRAAVLFCDDACLACCVANKVAGVRAAAVWTVPQAARAVERLGANLLVVETAGRTYWEFKEILNLCCRRTAATCPPGVACVLEELDGHAHR